MTMNGFEAERQLALAVWRTPTDPEGARRLFETVIQTAPDQPTYRLTFAHFLAHQHEWPAVQDQVAASATLDAERTLKWLQTKAEQNPDDPTWLHLHALLLARLGRDTQAAASFDRLLARPTVAGQVRVDYAALQAWQGDWSGAEANLKAALAEDPQQPAWLSAYGQLLYDQGRPDEALPHLKRAFELAPDDADLQARVGRVEHDLHARDETRRLERRGQAKAELARLKLEEGTSLDEVAALVDDALHLAPNYGLGHRMQGEVLWRRGRLLDAEASLERAIALEPHNDEYGASLRGLREAIGPLREQLVAQDAAERVAAGDLAEAVRRLKAALVDLPGSDLLAGRLAVALTRQGAVEEALPLFEQAVPVQRDADLLREYAVALRQTRRPAEAEAQFKQSLALAPANAVTLREYAALLADQQRYPEARSHMARALELAPDDAEAQAQAEAIDEQYRQIEQTEADLALAAWLKSEARVWEAQGDRAQALDYLARAQALEPTNPKLSAEVERLNAEVRSSSEVERLLAEARARMARHEDEAALQLARQVLELDRTDERVREYARTMVVQARERVERELAERERVERELEWQRSLAPERALAEEREHVERERLERERVRTNKPRWWTRLFGRGKDDEEPPPPPMPATQPVPAPSASPIQLGPRNDTLLLQIDRLRLDAAVPTKVFLGHVFILAVAMRQLSSLPLNEKKLRRVVSGSVSTRWHEDETDIGLRIQVVAAACHIHGPDTCSIRLDRGEDSPIFYFQLTPTVLGELHIVVKVFQEDNEIGDAHIPTMCQREVGSVDVKIWPLPTPGIRPSWYQNTPLDVSQDRLQHVLSATYDGDELKDLCVKLEVDYESLKGETKNAKARELILYCDRRERLPELIMNCYQQRPLASEWYE